MCEDVDDSNVLPGLSCLTGLFNNFESEVDTFKLFSNIRFSICSLTTSEDAVFSVCESFSSVCGLHNTPMLAVLCIADCVPDVDGTSDSSVGFSASFIINKASAASAISSFCCLGDL